MQLEPVAQGPRHAIYALAHGGRCQAIRFLSDLEKSDLNLTHAIAQRLRSIANEGIPSYNETVSRKVSDHCYELKVGRARLFWFYWTVSDRPAIIITHGWLKGPDKEQQRQIAAAERLFVEYTQTR